MSETTKEPFIKIEGLSKHFGDFAAVDNVDLEIYQSELFAILGGSGSGKTTLLRMLAGLETPSQGRIFIDGIDITDLPPYERPVNMMFQSYALFPHMSVEKNVGYGLKRDGVAPEDIAERVSQMLDLVQLNGFGKRKPDQLSGGQRQRVALARALIKKPKVFLLDEPLGALDKKLREETQFELMNIQEETGITFVVVTHDQEEAMTLANRIAVMNEGKFVQIGTPTQVYEYPESRFTADFIGTINMFDGTIKSVEDGQMTVDAPSVGQDLKAAAPDGAKPGDKTCIAVRPEKIWIARERPDEDNHTVCKGTVLDQGYFGNLSVYRVELETKQIIQVSAQNRVRLKALAIDWDETVYIHWDNDSVVVLDP